MEQLFKVLAEHFHTDHVEIASLGGSATWGMRFPEDIAPEAVVTKFESFDTPFGVGAAMKLLDISGKPVLRITHQGWKYGRNEFPSANDSLQVFWVLKQAGVKRVIVDGSCGGITVRQGDVVISSDFVDLYSNPITTQFAQTIGVDSWKRLAHPFCDELRQILLEEAVKERSCLIASENSYQIGRIYENGVYVTTPPGLFETAAQVSWYKQLGGDTVGQYLGFVAKLARICDMCIAAIHVISNDAEGMPADFGEIGLEDFYFACAKPFGSIVLRVLKRAVNLEIPDCGCQSYTNDTKMTGLPVEGA